VGGNALKRYATKRLNKDDYDIVVKEFSDIFETTFGFRPVEILAYKNKETFGDADLLLDSNKLPQFWKEDLRKTFQLTNDTYFPNGDVTSVGFKNFQIDLISTSNIAASFFYFSYNDLGNLLGRLSKKLGAKLGHNGLSIVVRHNDRSDHVLKEIHLTDNVEEMLDFVGVDYDRYLQGFDDLEDIFNFVISSKWFNRDIYLFDNRNSINRRRDKKRATYNGFLKFLEDTSPTNNHTFTKVHERGGYSIEHEYYKSEILSRWAWVEDEVNTVIENFELELKFKEIYNGNIVAKMTGYEGKTLGAFMSKIKPLLTNEYKLTLLAKPHLVELMVTQLWTQLGGVQFSA